MSECKNSCGEHGVAQEPIVHRVSPKKSTAEYELPHDLPENIKKLIYGKPYKTDDVGLSGSKIFMFDDYVLKIETVHDKAIRGQNDETVRVMRWLEGKLPVPKVLFYECDGGKQYLLMSRVAGKMSCETYYLERPRELVRLLASTLKMLWSIDV